MKFSVANMSFGSALKQFENCVKKTMEQSKALHPEDIDKRGNELPQPYYMYKVRLVPYVMESGIKKYVEATVDEVGYDVHVRDEVHDGQHHIVLEMLSHPEELLHLKLRYGQYTAKKWISPSMFNKTFIEVELKE